MPSPAPADPAHSAVLVRAPARLHLGFMDPSGTLGRRFGSLGLVIDGPVCEVEMSLAAADIWLADDALCAAELPRASAHLLALRQHSGQHAPLQMRLRRVMPAHAGFGSGTQLALAIGRAFAQLHGLDLQTAQLAQWLGRGRRSGIGIAGFDAGGLLLDGGPGAQAGEHCMPAPVLARVDTPTAWRVIVAEDRRVRGLSGDAERRSLATLPALAREQAADICHQVLMRVLPGAAADDFCAFALGINHMQSVLGSHFAPAQHGSAYTSPAVACLMGWLRGDSAAPRAAVGQSSWGPSGFAIVESATAARQLLAQAQQAGVLDEALRLSTVTVRRQGAEVLRVARGPDHASRETSASTPSPHHRQPHSQALHHVS